MLIPIANGIANSQCGKIVSVTKDTQKKMKNLSIEITSLYKNVFKIVVHNDLALISIPAHKTVKSETV